MKSVSLLPNQRVGVFFGGQSPEHDISIITGSFILAELKKQGMDAVPVYVCPQGNWYSDEALSELKFFQGDFLSHIQKLSSCTLDIPLSKNKIVLSKSSFFGKKEQVIDFVFPAFHGANGEDGTFQGLCEFFGVAYAGCGVGCSATTINKSLTKQKFLQEGINTSKYISVHQNEYTKDPAQVHDNVQSSLLSPIFVKPAKAGSSIGITQVSDKNDTDALQKALETAFIYDEEVVIENGVHNVRDLTCSVLSNGEEIWVSEIQESLFEKGFLSYEDKYLKDGGTQRGEATESLHIPANISKSQKEHIQSLSKQIFTAFGANGTLRVDFLMDNTTEEIFANEINTLPGTLYHHLWEKSGKSITEVLNAMILHGKNRSAMQKHGTSIRFQSSVLQDANGLKLQHAV